MSKTAKNWLIILVMVSFALRISLLFRNTFFPDEALFATWARQIATWRDPLLTNQLVDKPPLLFYLQAAFYPIFGPVEWAARMPNVIASITLIPLSAVLSRRLYRDDLQAMAVATLVAFSPMLIQFSATAFIDPLLTSLSLLSVVLATWDRGQSIESKAVRGRPVSRKIFLSGLAFGLAMATKYQALLVLPFLAGLALIYHWNRSAWRQWLLGLGTILIPLLIWQFSRGDNANIWLSQINSYGGLRLARSWELWDRIVEWQRLWGYLFLPEVFVLLVLIASLPLALKGWWKRDEWTALDQLLTLYILGYFLVHWISSINAWDRYLLLIAPFFAVLLVRLTWRYWHHLQQITFFRRIFSGTPRFFRWMVPLLFILIQFPLAIRASKGELPIGGRVNADRGAASIAEQIESQPEGTVLYDHWFSWQWRYHLFDSNIYVSWFPHAQALVEDLMVFGGQGDVRLIALPISTEAKPVVREIQNAGFDLVPITSNRSLSPDVEITIYYLSPGSENQSH